jgi:hypothetical protein
VSRLDQLSPLLLSVPIQAVPGTTAALASGQSASANSTLIINPNRTAMLVDQFRFIFAPGHANTVGVAFGEYKIYVELKLGAIPLTKGFVPIMALSPNYGYSNLSGFTQAMYVWHLPKPMYVPPGVQISAEFRAVLGAAETPLRFAIAGRSMPEGWPIPESIYVPWACATVVPAETTFTDGMFTSGDGDLINPHSEILRVKRFIGFKTAQVPGAAAAAFYGYNDTVYKFNLKMTLSSGKMMIRDPIPFTHLFPKSRRYFDVDAVLQPNEFIRAIMKYEAPAVDTTDGEYAFMGPAYIGMIGYREVGTPRGVMP